MSKRSATGIGRGRLRRWVGRVVAVPLLGAVLWATTAQPKALDYPGFALAAAFFLMDIRILGRPAERRQRSGAIAVRFLALAAGATAAVVERQPGWIAVYLGTAVGMHLWERWQQRRETELEELLHAVAAVRHPTNVEEADEFFHRWRPRLLGSVGVLVVALLCTTSPTGRAVAENAAVRVDKTTDPFVQVFQFVVTFIPTPHDDASPPRFVSLPATASGDACRVTDDVRPQEQFRAPN